MNKCSVDRQLTPTANRKSNYNQIPHHALKTIRQNSIANEPLLQKLYLKLNSAVYILLLSFEIGRNIHENRKSVNMFRLIF